MLVHLLYPEHFERIASRNHKRRVLEAFGGLVTEKVSGEDRLLYEIRSALSKLMPHQRLDYYEPPLVAAWYDAGEADERAPIELIQFKKQAILYGPPGTRKTYRAKHTAARVIR